MKRVDRQQLDELAGGDDTVTTNTIAAQAADPGAMSP
jgi:hypothetical protein